MENKMENKIKKEKGKCVYKQSHISTPKFSLNLSTTRASSTTITTTTTTITTTTIVVVYQNAIVQRRQFLNNKPR